ncbi:MAG: TonB family protein [Bacteroidetes bacterium]|jgi:protein TonB|nr:TonB family protein [Bacteroidota bacterium]
MEFIYSNRWCELMFENRNKGYGAYLLRKKNADYVILSLIVAVGILFSAMAFFYHLGGPSAELIQQFTDKTKKPDVVYTIERIIPPATPTAPQKPVAPMTVHSRGQGAPVVVNQTVTQLKTISSITPVGTDISGDNTSGSSDVLPGTGGNGTAVMPDATAPMLRPEVMPEFPGGEAALIRFLQKNIHYPQELLMSGVQGTVYLGFVIDKNGNVTDIKVLKGIAQAVQFSDEAIRVLEKSPSWKPGLQGGNPVAVTYTLPVTFVAK